MSANVIFPPFARHQVAPTAAQRLRRAWAGFGQALRVVGTRRHLADMDDRMLADIGASRADALFEAARAPWDTAPRRHR